MYNIKKRNIAIGIIVFLLIISSVIIYKHCNNTIKGIDKYDENYCNFSLDELGNYNDVYYQCTKTGGILFTSYGALIIADYDELSFEKQVNVLTEREFQEDIVLFEETKYILPETNFSIENWDFKVLKNDENHTYPKDINLVAFNEAEKKIAYLTFTDQDLDYLCKADESKNYMQKFVNKYFKYGFKND